MTDPVLIISFDFLVHSFIEFMFFKPKGHGEKLSAKCQWSIKTVLTELS